MLKEKISTELTNSILKDELSFETLMSLIKNNPEMVEFLNNNNIKIPYFLNTLYDKESTLIPSRNSALPSENTTFKKIKDVFFEIPCIHYLLFKFKNDKEELDYLMKIFKIDPFKISYVVINDKRYALLGFNLYSLFGFKINQETSEIFPINVKNKEEFFNYYYEKKNNNNYFSIYSENLFPLFNFKLTTDDLLYDNNEMTTEERKIKVHLLGKDVNCFYKNLSEFTPYEREYLDNLIQYKIKKNEIDFNLSNKDLIDLLILKNYFIKSYVNSQFCIQLSQRKPELFTQEIMTLLCFKNPALHEELSKHKVIKLREKKPELFTQEIMSLISLKKYNLYEKLNKNTSSILYENKIYQNKIMPTYFKEKETKEGNTVHEYIAMKNEIINLADTLVETDILVRNAWLELKINIENICLEKSTKFLNENIEEKITFENILSKYIPTVFNNYLSIATHLRSKENFKFVSMTITQFNYIKKELEKIETTIMEEDLKKMKIWGNFLDKRLNDNSADIVDLNYFPKKTK